MQSGMQNAEEIVVRVRENDESLFRTHDGRIPTPKKELGSLGHCQKPRQERCAGSDVVAGSTVEPPSFAPRFVTAKIAQRFDALFHKPEGPLIMACGLL